MCLVSANQLKEMALKTEQIEKLKELEIKNKAAAKEQLLRIQLLLARNPIK